MDCLNRARMVASGLLEKKLSGPEERFAGIQKRREVLEFQFRNQLQQPKQCCAFLRSEFLSDFFVGSHPHANKTFPVLMAFCRQANVDCSARFCFSLRQQAFLNHRLDGPVHNSSVKAKKLGDLILIEPNAAAEGGQDEAASRGALSFSFQSFAHGKICGGDMRKHRIPQDVWRNIRLWTDDHRTVTVASSGLRH